MNVLFVTWDGPQVSYLESLFIPIFNRLSEFGFHFHVLQFSWCSSQVMEQRRQECESKGFSYTYVPVIRKHVALGGLVTSLLGYRQVRKAVVEHDIDVVMARSTLPALSTLLYLRGRTTPFVFDADGLPLDERIDFAGQRPSSLVYRLLRDIEAQAVRRSDAVLTRSRKAVSILQARAGAGTTEDKFHVVSNGRDKALFSPGEVADRIAVKERLGIAVDAPLVVYAGSLGPQYSPESMLGLFALIRESRPDAHFLVLSGSPEVMTDLLSAYGSSLATGVTVMRVGANEVPRWLASADLGMAFREPTFSMQGVAPIKLGEYLLCGVPVVATRGVGDSHFIDKNSGFPVDGGDAATLSSVADWFIHKVLPLREEYRAHCRSVGVEHFSLESSVEAYRKALLSVQVES
ncbi:glycosyltransferase family 4 protein [Alcanivorax sp. NBRC 102028]|uniref:glycosyltransferase family 4 protein n=1 Tax=Alcanivorax sp. NBRC 102028 TaxID=1113897 RepID=UPI000789F47C|nr:glycosyltransferase family 4 protein [Alcanivorax sp. NBRC 102028]